MNSTLFWQVVGEAWDIFWGFATTFAGAFLAFALIWWLYQRQRAYERACAGR